MSGRLRAGVIGLGVGERHVVNFGAHEDCTVTHICDVNPEKLAEVSQRHPHCQLVSNAEEILCNDEIDIVSIASFDDAHYEQVMTAINQNKHVMVEKPMCQSREQAEAIYENLQKHPTVHLSSNHPLRNSSRFKEIRQQIRNGEFGKVYFVEGDYQYGRLTKLTQGWRGKLDYYSVVQGGAVHMVDLLLWMLDTEVTEVVAMGNKLVSQDTDFRFDDNVVALLRLQDGALAKVTGNFSCVRPHFHSVHVFGERQTFINHDGDAELFVSSDKDSRPKTVTTPYRDYHQAHLFTSFVDAILGKGTAQVTASEVFRAMGVCFTIEDAVRTGNTTLYQRIDS